MTQKDWRDLLPLVNNEDFYQLIQMYAKERIETLRNQLEMTKGEDNFSLVQGKLLEARLLLLLRETVIQNAK
jgi:hypothetical protein|tara:strand:- start:394 stop:609 length:216 start_codon:yes stop_codon:yes gene_type:complete